MTGVELGMIIRHVNVSAFSDAIIMVMKMDSRMPSP